MMAARQKGLQTILTEGRNVALSFIEDIVMAQRRSSRTSIRMFDHERKFLVKLYLTRRIPIDQFEARPKALQELCDEWRGHCSRKDSNGEILHYMRTQRKRGKWVRLGDDHELRPALPDLTAEETETLIDIFDEEVAELGEGSDNIAYDADLAQRIAKRFAEATHRMFPASQLVAKITAIRKRGLLPRAKEQELKTDDMGFDDIDSAQ
jgi:hypothetical protein